MNETRDGGAVKLTRASAGKGGELEDRWDENGNENEVVGKSRGEEEYITWMHSLVLQK